LNEVKAKAVVTPQSLPMVYPPAIWGENKTGGFLTNIIDHKSLVTGSAQHNHKINLNDATYDSINYLNSQSFEVNSELHNYIVNEGNYIIDYIREHDNKNYFNFLLTLDIAKTYLNQNIYLNVNIDWRGRIYVQSFYINYQGSDLSIALVNLEKSQVMTEEGLYYLYIYGANSYNENSLSKNTFEERYSWVVNNLDKI
jgi:DNA-directed RNA polymerase